MDNLWVVLISRQIADSIRKDLESGRFADATNSTNLLKSFQQNLSNICQKSGGHVHTFLPEWITIECQPSIVEQIPSIIDNFNDQIGHSIACGIGKNFNEAVKSALESEKTGHIVLYQENVAKAEEQEIPPNLFDYENQKVANTEKTKTNKIQYAVAPDFQTASKISQAYVQNMVEHLGENAMQEMQQKMAAEQQKAMEAQKKPRDLIEALHGKQIDSRNPYSQNTPQNNAPQNENSKEKGQLQQNDKNQDSPEIEKDEMGESENDNLQQKLGGTLLHIKEQIPQLMDLSERNPDAFKQTLALIQKILNLTKRTKQKTYKSEIESTTEVLNKRLKALPIGTTRNRKKKVLVNGKAVWRSMASGMVQDLTGEPISVRSSNLAAQKGKQAGEK